jgi:hypothetical protein
MKFPRLPNLKLELKRLCHSGFVDNRNVTQPHAMQLTAQAHQEIEENQKGPLPNAMDRFRLAGKSEGGRLTAVSKSFDCPLARSHARSLLFSIPRRFSRTATESRSRTA